MKFTDSNPTLGMAKDTSSPEGLLPTPQRLARRSFIRSLATSAAMIMLVCSAPGHLAQAADGDLDPTFGTGGMVTTDLNRSTDIANAVAVQADGKLVVVGTSYKQNDYSDEDFVVTRYNTNGTSTTPSALEAKCEQISPAWRRYPHQWLYKLTAKSWSRAARFRSLPFWAISK